MLRPSFGFPKWMRIFYWSPAVLYLTTQVCIPLKITGRSMQPTLNPYSSPSNDIAIFDRISRYFDQARYRPGDIVYFRSPTDPNLKFVKRIIAIEGEIVSTLPPYPDTTVRVPKGHMWVQGDEPFHSDDSNTFGPIPMSLVESKLVWIAWPLSRFGSPSPPLKRIFRARNDDVYHHAITTFAKDRTRTATITFNGDSKP